MPKPHKIDLAEKVLFPHESKMSMEDASLIVFGRIFHFLGNQILNFY